MNKLKIRSGHIYIDDFELITVTFCEIQRNVYTTKLKLKLDVNKDLPRKEKRSFPELKIYDTNNGILIWLDDCKLENILDYTLIVDDNATSELTLTMYVDEVQVVGK